MGLLLRWKYAPDSDPLRDADVIIGMAFGANRKGKQEAPGLSNVEIARIIQKLWTKKSVPVVVQREVAEALENIEASAYPTIVVSEADDQSHITSYEVLRKAWRYCNARGLRHAVIVAHPAHILRCARVASKLGFSVKLPNVGSIPYEPRSKQWWTRNAVAYFVWEVRARIGWWICGYM